MSMQSVVSFRWQLCSPGAGRATPSGVRAGVGRRCARARASVGAAAPEAKFLALLGCNRHCCQLLLMVRPATLLPTVANDPGLLFAAA